jgi:hypothetical protein
LELGDGGEHGGQERRTRRRAGSAGCVRALLRGCVSVTSGAMLHPYGWIPAVLVLVQRLTLSR